MNSQNLPRTAQTELEAEMIRNGYQRCGFGPEGEWTTTGPGVPMFPRAYSVRIMQGQIRVTSAKFENGQMVLNTVAQFRTVEEFRSACPEVSEGGQPANVWD